MDDRQALAARALALIDLTDLADDATAERTEALCRRALGPFGTTAAVCVWPRFVGVAATALDGTSVRVATVVNFPDGGTDVRAVVDQAVGALADGADEIDLVLPYRAFAAGRVEVAARMLDAVRSAAAPPAHLKVILETGELGGAAQISAAAALAIRHDADFIKTSTGTTPVSATPEAVEIMLGAIRELGAPVGIKPSGGIRTLDAAAGYLAQADRIMGQRWASPATFRFGASGLLDALEAELAGTAPDARSAGEPAS